MAACDHTRVFMLIAAAALITAHVIPAPGSAEQVRLEARSGYTQKSGLKNADSEPVTDTMELAPPWDTSPAQFAHIMPDGRASTPFWQVTVYES